MDLRKMLLKLKASDYISILAFLTSIVLPLTLRECDRRDSLPKVEVVGRHRFKVDPQMYPELIENCLEVMPQLQHLGRYLVSSGLHTLNYRAIFSWLYEYRVIDLEVSNQRNYPVSLSQLHSDTVYYSAPIKDTRFKILNIFLMGQKGQSYRMSPTLNLEPNEKKTFKIIVQCGLEMGNETKKFLNKSSKNTLKRVDKNLTSEGIEFIPIGNPTKDSIESSFVLKSVYIDYSTSVRLDSLTISVRDNFGREFQTKPFRADEIVGTVED